MKNMIIKMVICDDEPKYRQLLHKIILQDSFACDYEVEITEYESGAGLVEALDKGLTADVYFLDIQMENGTNDGIQVARELRRRKENGLIVYVTSFIDYVQTGYEVRAFRYLLKSQIEDKLAQVLEDIREELFGEGFFCFKTKGETIRIDKREILYLESNKRQLQLVTAETEYNFYGSMENAEKELGQQFLRCHQSYLVNIKLIQKFSNEQIELQGGIAVPVSRSYAKKVKQRLMLEMI